MTRHFNLNSSDLQVTDCWLKVYFIGFNFLQAPDRNIKHNLLRNTKNIPSDEIQRIKYFLSHHAQNEKGINVF